VTGILTELLEKQRTWTSRQLAAALAERGIALGARQVRRYLGMLNAGWQRTAHSLRHKQDPAKVARAEGVLDSLEKKRRPAAWSSTTSTSAASRPRCRRRIVGPRPGGAS